MTVQEATKKHIAECRERILRIKRFAKTNKDADVNGCEENVFVLKNAMESLEEVEQYRALGTVEELKEAREKQVAKKPIGRHTDYKCSVCGRRVRSGKGSSSRQRDNFCQRCGTKIDWEEGAE